MSERAGVMSERAGVMSERAGVMSERAGVLKWSRPSGMGRPRWGVLMIAVLVGLVGVASAQPARAGQAHTIDLVIVGGALPGSDAGEPTQLALSAEPQNPPDVGAESQITGPTWSWTITATKWLNPKTGQLEDSPYVSDSLALQDPATQDAVLNATFKRAGSWTITVKVTVDYSDPASGDTWHGEQTADISGSATLLATLQVQRSFMGNGYGGSTIVAAGGVAPDEHFADVQITTKDSKGNGVAGVYVDAPTLTGANGGDVAGSFGMSSGVTDSTGHITALKAFHSSDTTIDSPTITLKDASGATLSSATIAQDWDDVADGSDWIYDDFFDIGSAAQVTFAPELIDGTKQVPITGHTMEFVLTGVTGTITDPVSGQDTHYTYQSTNPTGANYRADLSAFGTFDPESVKGGGTYSSYLTITDATVDTIDFNAVDDNVYLD